jgi:hypothetical protein
MTQVASVPLLISLLAAAALAMRSSNEAQMAARRVFAVVRRRSADRRMR